MTLSDQDLSARYQNYHTLSKEKIEYNILGVWGNIQATTRSFHKYLFLPQVDAKNSFFHPTWHGSINPERLSFQHPSGKFPPPSTPSWSCISCNNLRKRCTSPKKRYVIPTSVKQRNLQPSASAMCSVLVGQEAYVLMVDLGYIQCISRFTMPMLSENENENYFIRACGHACGWVIDSKLSYPFRWVDLSKSWPNKLSCSLGPLAVATCGDPIEKIVEKISGDFRGRPGWSGISARSPAVSGSIAAERPNSR